MSSFKDELATGARDSREYQRMRRAVDKARGDFEEMKRQVARLYGVHWGAVPLTVRNAAMVEYKKWVSN